MWCGLCLCCEIYININSGDSIVQNVKKVVVSTDCIMAHTLTYIDTPLMHKIDYSNEKRVFYFLIVGSANSTWFIAHVTYQLLLVVLWISTTVIVNKRFHLFYDSFQSSVVLCLLYTACECFILADYSSNVVKYSAHWTTSSVSVHSR